MHPSFKPELEQIEEHLRSVLKHTEPCPLPGLNRFWETMSYSLFSPGKRFRPLLSLLTAKALEKPQALALPIASAVELIHTYSLIHDDLPCMDNDDFRRGMPTSHKKFGEAQALLAGDGLLTLAFGVLSEAPAPDTAVVVRLLSKAAGPVGMVGGQVLDIDAKAPNVEQLHEIHQRKTGALIRVAVEGAARLCGATPEQVEKLRAYGEHLGMAFQLADDIQDFNPEEPEKVSYVTLLGLRPTLMRLEESSQAALAALTSFPQAEGLRLLVRLNRERV